MLDSWLNSEPFQKLRAARRAVDVARQSQIYETTIASMAGPEKAFWILIRQGFKLQINGYPPEQAWSDLEAALQIAPDHPDIRETVLIHSLAAATYTQQLDRFYPMLRVLRAEFRILRKSFWIQHNLAVLQMERGKWKAALRNFTLALRQLEEDEENLRRTGDHRPTMYAMRAVAALACGLPEQAAEDLDTACAAAAAKQAAYVPWLVLALAKAELAFHRGEFHTARAELQLGLMNNHSVAWTKAKPLMEVRAELLAARMARAEGNLKGFAHFCERALELARQKNLPLSEGRVRAVLAGAER